MRRIAAALALFAGAAAAAPPSLHVEELTWTELRDAVAAGATTALVPVGGTEQSGPHLALGKHNARARVLAERIAQALGGTLVAPVVAYVPEGSVEPPTQHMRWPGTISIPAAAFEATLEGAARSLCRAGFRDVVLLGDHGGYAQSLERVAARFGVSNASRGPCRVHALAEYYAAATRAFGEQLAARGLTPAEIGRHAGSADTALTQALAPSLVRPPQAPKPGDGTDGDPRRASAELGRLGAQGIVEASAAAIRRRVAAAR